MKRNFHLLLFILVPVLAFSQDTKVTTGVVNYDSREYKKAVANFEIALADISSLKPQNVPKAYYYYGKSLFMEYGPAFGENMDAFEQNCLKALDAFNNAIKHDDGSWKAKVQIEKDAALTMILNFGIMHFNKIQLVRPDEKTALLEKTDRYFTIGRNEMPDNYYPFDLSGQLYLTRKDSVKAQENFEKSIRLFESKKPAVPDLKMAYATYRLAVIERYKNKNNDKALAWIEKGKAIAQSEYDRSSAKTPELKKELDLVLSDLSAMELDIYLNVPEKQVSALQKFEKAIQEQPENYNVHLAYASLLESVDEAKAIIVYEKAIQINPAETTAWYNLGAFYNNIGARYSKQSNATEDVKKGDELRERSMSAFGKAYPNFQKVLELNPKSLESINALIQLAGMLGKNDDYILYKEKRKNFKY